jgi:imidazolonepropionase-like amidohydrolase
VNRQPGRALVAHIFIFGAMFVLAASLRAEKLALINGTVINPGDGKIISRAVVVVEGNRIASVGTKPPSDAKVVDCKGRFILPGYIDTHVHFFQSGDLFARPDGADFNSVRPYKDEVAWIKSHLDDTFARYIRCGITSVVDIGGPMWNFEVRKRANATAKAPRVAVAGPLISSVSREKLDLGDPPIVKIDSPDQAREFVRKLAEQKSDLVKIWYIVDQDHPVDSFRPIARATIEESHAHKIRVAVHATELETARAAVEEGADILVHSVVDKPVDAAFVEAFKGSTYHFVSDARCVRALRSNVFPPTESHAGRTEMGKSGGDRIARRHKNSAGQIAGPREGRGG